jgi:O-antigen/teichoic acid export membrane protein
MVPYRPALTLRSWRRLIGFSFWSWLQAMLFQIRDRGDSIIIGRILGTTQFGFFSIGAEFGSLPVTEVVEPLGRALFSGFALLHRSEGSPTQLYLTAVEVSVMLILPAGLGISMVADPMVRLILGTEWLNVVPVIQIIGVASTVSIFGYFSGTFLSAGGKMRDTFLLSSLSVSIRIPLMIALVYAWGLTGAAVAASIALMVDQILFLWRSMQRLGITITGLLSRIWRATVASLAMVGCLHGLGMAWTTVGEAPGASVAGDLVMRCAIGAAVYAAALLAIWILAGRPDGVERQALMAARRQFASLRAML